MSGDVISERGLLFLGSRMRRLGERMQADVARVIEQAGLPLQPSHYPLLATVDREGPMTIGAMAQSLGLSQPAVTRSVARLAELGLVATTKVHRDQRHKTVALTEQAQAVLAQSAATVWPRVEAAVAEVCGDGARPLLALLARLERGLDDASLDRRAPMLTVLPFSDDLAPAFHDINAQWIETMFTLEPTDREVLEQPRARIIALGGDIRFVAAEGLGVVGACALQKTGERRFELTKMGVLPEARGRKAGEFLLRAMIARAAELGAETLYLLTNARCAPAIHLYEKVGFVRDAEIMRDYGGRYARCDVAMRYRVPE